MVWSFVHLLQQLGPKGSSKPTFRQPADPTTQNAASATFYVSRFLRLLLTWGFVSFMTNCNTDDILLLSFGKQPTPKSSANPTSRQPAIPLTPNASFITFYVSPSLITALICTLSLVIILMIIFCCIPRRSQLQNPVQNQHLGSQLVLQRQTQVLPPSM